MGKSVRMGWWISALAATLLPPPGLTAAIPADGDLSPSLDLPQSDVTNADTGPAVSAALADVVTECLPRMSLDCAQWRMARLIRYLDAMPQFPLLEGLVYVVRVGTEATQARLASSSTDGDGAVGGGGGSGGGDGGEGSRQLEAAVSDFFERHVLRLQLPMWFGDAVRPNTVDFALKPDADAGSARKKKGGGGGKKGMKKMMMMISMMMMGKMMMVLPMVMTIIKLKAIKALLIGSLALMISKIMLIKKLLGSKLGGGGGGGATDKHVIVLHADSHGGGGHGGSGPSGGGGDWSSGGGGGGGWMGSGGGGGGGGDWSSRGADLRSLDDAHDLAYRGHHAASGWSASQSVARR